MLVLLIKNLDYYMLHILGIEHLLILVLMCVKNLIFMLRVNHHVVQELYGYQKILWMLNYFKNSLVFLQLWMVVEVVVLQTHGVLFQNFNGLVLVYLTTVIFTQKVNR